MGGEEKHWHKKGKVGNTTQKAGNKEPAINEQPSVKTISKEAAQKEPIQINVAAKDSTTKHFTTKDHTEKNVVSKEVSSKDVSKDSLSATSTTSAISAISAFSGSSDILADQPSTKSQRLKLRNLKKSSSERRSPRKKGLLISSKTATKSLGPRRPKGRRVKFADPISHHHIIERVFPWSSISSIVPNKEPEKSKSDSHNQPRTDLSALTSKDPELQKPPLSLVAQMELAAKRLHLRDSSTSTSTSTTTPHHNKDTDHHHTDHHVPAGSSAKVNIKKTSTDSTSIIPTSSISNESQIVNVQHIDVNSVDQQKSYSKSVHSINKNQDHLPDKSIQQKQNKSSKSSSSTVHNLETLNYENQKIHGEEKKLDDHGTVLSSSKLIESSDQNKQILSSPETKHSSSDKHSSQQKPASTIDQEKDDNSNSEKNND